MKPLSAFYGSSDGAAAAAVAGSVIPPQVIDDRICPQVGGLPSFDNDGSYIMPPGEDTGEPYLWRKYSKTNALVWSVAPADIHADAPVAWIFHWYDSVDDALWVGAGGAINIGEIWVAKIADSDGTVTYVGKTTLSSNFQGTLVSGHRRRGNWYAARAAAGSGDITIYNLTKFAVISSANASEVTPPALITQDGVNIIDRSGYLSADGKVMCTGIHSERMRSVDAVPHIEVKRGGALGLCLLPPWPGFPYTFRGRFELWDGYVALVPGGDETWSSTYSATTTWSTFGPRFFDRTDFDRWLNDLADALGLPEAA